MKLSQKLILTDTLIQGALLAAIIPGPVLGLVAGNSKWLALSLYSASVLGAWQFLGNLFWMVFKKDPARKWYLLIVTIFFLLGFLLSWLVPENPITEKAGLVYWTVLPFALAVWYFRITAGQMQESYRAPRSFWDL